jgi:hypothetical protein
MMTEATPVASDALASGWTFSYAVTAASGRAVRIDADQKFYIRLDIIQPSR